MNQEATPLVSIGVPVYNGAETLATALESLVNQDYPNIELIISDNASTDNTLKICERFWCLDSRVQIIRKSVNEGAVGNFRTVLEAADGKYFMWAAADDYWCPEFVSRLVPLLEHDPSVGVAMSGIERRYPDGKRLDLHQFSYVNEVSRFGHFRLFFRFFSKVKYSLFIYGLFRTSLLKKAIPSFPEITGGDRQFMSHFALVCRFASVDDVLHVRTYQPKNEQKYWEEMSQPGILWSQAVTFMNMVWCSTIIPWWRKVLVLPLLPKFIFFNFRQTPVGREMKRLVEKMMAMTNIKQFFILSHTAIAALAVFWGVVATGLIFLTRQMSQLDVLVMVSLLGFVVLQFLALWVRRIVIQSQKSLRQTLVANNQEYIDLLAKLQDSMEKRLTQALATSGQDFKTQLVELQGYLEEKLQQILSNDHYDVNNELAKSTHNLRKELRYLTDTVLHPDLAVSRVKGNKLSSHLFERIEKHRKVVSFVRNLEESRIREVYLQELFPDIQTESVPIGVINELTGHANKTDMLYVAAIAKHLAANKIFEFGTYTGRTTFYLAHNNPSASVVTLNLPPEKDLRYGPFLGVMFKGTQEEKRITQLLADSREFDIASLRRQFDFVFVDGDHSYELVQNDTQKAFELLKPGGTIMWHDYAPKSEGLVRFFQVFTQEQPVFRIRSTCLLIYVDGVNVMKHKLGDMPNSLERELRKQNPYLVESLYHS